MACLNELKAEITPTVQQAKPVAVREEESNRVETDILAITAEPMNAGSREELIPHVVAESDDEQSVVEKQLTVEIDGQSVSIAATKKNRYYLLYMLTKGIFPQFTISEKELLAFIAGTTPKTFETTINKANSDGEGHLCHKEKQFFAKIAEKYGLAQEPN